MYSLAKRSFRAACSFAAPDSFEDLWLFSVGNFLAFSSLFDSKIARDKELSNGNSMYATNRWRSVLMPSHL